MFLNLIATFAVGFGAGGLAYGLNRLTGRRFPRWVTPIAAGGAMFAFQMWNEYTWFDRTVAALPAETKVVDTVLYRHPIQPWTLVFPRIFRFDAVNTASIERHQGPAPILRVEIQRHERFAQKAGRWWIFDCATPRGAPHLSERFTAEGLPRDEDWIALAADEPIRKAACAAY